MTEAGIIAIGLHIVLSNKQKVFFHRTNTDKISSHIGHYTSLTNHQLPNPTFALPRLVVFLALWMAMDLSWDA
jgi:hypothetical protein